jgi:hypothetical protein
MSKCLPEQSLMCNCLCARWPDRISQKNPVITQIAGFDYITTRLGNYMDTAHIPGGSRGSCGLNHDPGCARNVASDGTQMPSLCIEALSAGKYRATYKQSRAEIDLPTFGKR